VRAIGLPRGRPCRRRRRPSQERHPAGSEEGRGRRAAWGHGGAPKATYPGADQGRGQEAHARSPTTAKPVAPSRAPAKKTVAKVKALGADTRPATTTGSTKASLKAPAFPSSLKKVEQDLLKLGAKRPARLARLRGVLKSLLGPDAASDAIDAALSSLKVAGIVAVDRSGQVSYPTLS
jgi:hypothetical protein